MANNQEVVCDLHGRYVSFEPVWEFNMDLLGISSEIVYKDAVRMRRKSESNDMMGDLSLNV